MPASPRPIPREQLDIACKTRSNLFAWRGQFSPQLVEVLIRSYAPPRALVLDPFVGSGTVLYEAGLLGLQAVGAEINPAAVSMARVYELINMAHLQRLELLAQIDRDLRACPAEDMPLFRADGSPVPQGGLLEELVGLAKACEPGPRRGVLEALVTLTDDYPNRPGPALIYSKWGALRRVASDLPYSAAPIRALVADARRLPLPKATVDFVVSSPPYINVFNYHQQYRAAAELLGADLLRVARSEIGANRKHRQNRFLTVVQYCLDMAAVLGELKRVCKRGAPVVLVVGRVSNVRKTAFFNSDIIETLATDCVGFSCPLRQERVFTNRFGLRIYEDVLHLVNDGSRVLPANCSPRRVGYYALKSARNRAPEEAKADLDDSIAMADRVEESPVLDPCRDRDEMLAKE